MEYPEVAVVVLNYNGKKYLENCFNSLKKSTYPNAKYYLLDNASTEPDVNYIKNHFPWVKIIQNSQNNGFCAAYNLALTHCEEPYFVCINNDLEVHPQWLSEMMKLATKDKSIAAIQPKILDYYQRDTLEYSGAAGGMLDIYGFPFARGRIFGVVEKDEGQFNEPKEIFWACGACLLLNKDALNETGYFDDTIIHHMDEIDLCWRFYLMGYTVWYSPKSEIYHIGGGTIKVRGYKKTYWNHRNSIYLLLKNYLLFNAIKNTLIHVGFDYIALGQSLLKGNFNIVKGILMAHLWIIFNPLTIIKNRRLVQQKRKRPDNAIAKHFYPRSIVLDHFLFGKTNWKQLKFKYENRTN